MIEKPKPVCLYFVEAIGYDGQLVQNKDMFFDGEKKRAEKKLKEQSEKYPDVKYQLSEYVRVEHYERVCTECRPCAASSRDKVVVVKG